MQLTVVRFTMYFCSDFMDISKPIDFWKDYNIIIIIIIYSYNARSHKNNAYVCVAAPDPRCHGPRANFWQVYFHIISHSPVYF